MPLHVLVSCRMWDPGIAIMVEHQTASKRRYITVTVLQIETANFFVECVPI